MGRAISVRGSLALLVLTFVGALSGAPTFAQTVSDPAAIATYTGPDRDKLLNDGGKAEGVVSIYSSAHKGGAYCRLRILAFSKVGAAMAGVSRCPFTPAIFSWWRYIGRDQVSALPH